MDNKKNSNTLYEKLNTYANQKTVPMHMPGHKRNDCGLDYLQNLSCKMDITEIDGFDNLHHPEGILKESMQLASDLWQCKQSYFLVNGSTCGILASIRATAQKGSILIARNCHKAVYHALEICDLNAYYVYPEILDHYYIYGSVTPECIEKSLKSHSDIQTVLITSPTYEGVISDVERISAVCHQYGAVLIVDEAHGAHLDLSDCFTGGAVRHGADMVIQSLHKTLPSLTQTAILHLCSERIAPKEIERQLRIFETSSPSYILLSSIDGCVRFLSEHADSYFERWKNLIEQFLEQTKTLCHLKILTPVASEEIYQFDQSKIVISCAETNLSGKELMRILREKCGIELEMAYHHYALAMTGLFDSEENLCRLSKALLEIDSQCQKEKNSATKMTVMQHESDCSASKAVKNPYRVVSAAEAIGQVSAEYIWAYPPGIPYIVPGEVIREDILTEIRYARENDIEVISDYADAPLTIAIIK